MSDCKGLCYDCPNKWTTAKCSNEDEKYKAIMKDINSAIKEYGDIKFWISVDWEETDVVAMRAWDRAKEWLMKTGFAKFYRKSRK